MRNKAHVPCIYMQFAGNKVQVPVIMCNVQATSQVVAGKNYTVSTLYFPERRLYCIVTMHKYPVITCVRFLKETIKQLRCKYPVFYGVQAILWGHL